MTDPTVDALATAMYDAEDNRCSGYPGECCAPTTHGSATAIRAALADAGYVVVRAEEVERWQRVETAAEAIRDNPVNAYDRPQSWRAQAQLMDALAALEPKP